MAALSETIKRRRLELGKKQSDIAKACGLTTSFISKLERGKEMGSAKTLVKLAAGLEWPTSRLLEESGLDVYGASPNSLRDAIVRIFDLLPPPAQRDVYEIVEVVHLRESRRQVAATEEHSLQPAA